MTDDVPLRSQTHAIEIEAEPAAVWRAITEPGELLKWYLEQARGEAGPGALQEISWERTGDCMPRAVTLWEPERRVRFAAPEGEAPPAAEGGAMAEEYELEARDGRTCLRLVFSGLPEGESWDSMFEGTDVGFEMFLATLKHYLERHDGKDRRTVYRCGEVDADRAEAYRWLTGPELLAREGSLAGARPGERFAVTTAAGTPIEGSVVIAEPGKALTLRLESHADALLAATFHPAGKGSFANLILSTYGRPADEVVALEAEWQPLFATLVPSAASCGA